MYSGDNNVTMCNNCHKQGNVIKVTVRILHISFSPSHVCNILKGSKPFGLLI